MEYFLLLISTILVNNVVLVRFLGLCPFMGVSNKLSAAWGMGMATTFVITLGALLCWVVETFILQPLNIGFLRILSFILVVAAVVQFTELFVKKSSPSLYKALGIYLPLIVTNCAVLGIPLLTVRENYNLVQSVLYAFGSAVGFSMMLVIFAGIRERIALARVPAMFNGAPIAFITAGLLALIFMGFSGLAAV